MTEARAPAAEDPFRIVGTIFQRTFLVERVVAHGGFGVVYRARHQALGSELALKLLKPQRAADPEEWADLLAQFLEEAKTLARLRHPNVVAVLDAGIAHLEGAPGGVPWMALEWLDGVTLRDELAARRGSGGRSPSACLALLRPVLEAIADAHEAGIVHRDLKPSNIMMVPTRQGPSARVLDFGIAKMVEPEASGESPSGDTATASRAPAFTPASAAPEQLSGTRSSPRTDVYALALLLTEVLTDRAPLPLDDPNEHYRAVFAAERPTPRALGVDVGAWEAVLARALAVAPKERQANARVLLAELEATLERALEGDRSDVELRPALTEDPGGRATTGRRPGTADAPGAAARGEVRALGSRTKLAIGLAAVLALGGVAAFPRAPVSGAGPSPRASEAKGASACTAKACSVALGAPAICGRAGACVALASEDCVVHAEPPDLERDDTVWIGAMFPRTGPAAATEGIRNHHAVELARRDFASVMGGGPEGRARPLALLECDDAVDAPRAARHLVDEVGTPAVIGFQSGVEAIELANALFVPRRVLVVVATNTNPMLTRVPQPDGAPRLVFRTTHSGADTVGAASKFIADVLEPDLERLRSPATEPLRIATLRAKAAGGADLADALRERLRFNGKSTLENGDAYQDLSYDLSAAEGSAEMARVVDALLAFRPHMIVYAGRPGAAGGLITPVERRWAAGATRPRWIVVSERLDELIAVVRPARDALERFYGVTPMFDTSANARFVQHYSETFPEPVARNDCPNSSYDAFYLAALATYAIPAGERVSGDALSRGLARLVPPGAEVETGIAGIFDAYKRLSAGESVDLTGATGKLDFDLARGESAFDHAILCVGLDPTGHPVSAASGLIYQAATGSLKGALREPCALARVTPVAPVGSMASAPPPKSAVAAPPSPGSSASSSAAPRGGLSPSTLGEQK